MGPIWGRQDPGGPPVGPMNFAIWDPDNSYMITSLAIIRSPGNNSQESPENVNNDHDKMKQTKTVSVYYGMYVAYSDQHLCIRITDCIRCFWAESVSPQLGLEPWILGSVLNALPLEEKCRKFSTPCFEFWLAIEILPHVMAWCRQASHYLNQCWPRSMLTTYGVSEKGHGIQHGSEGCGFKSHLCDIHLRAISLEDIYPWIEFENTFLNMLLHIPEANEFTETHPTLWGWHCAYWWPTTILWSNIWCIDEQVRATLCARAVFRKYEVYELYWVNQLHR